MQSKVSARSRLVARETAKAQDNVKDEAKDRARHAIKAQAEVVVSAAASEVARVMDELVDRGDIVLAELPEGEEPEADDPAMEDALASDFDWFDEDQEVFEPDMPLPRHEFVIRVCREKQDDGREVLSCLPPYSDWSGAEGKTDVGRECVKVLNLRLRTYRVIGEFLVREHARELKQGPKALSLGLEQKSFAAKWLESEGVDTSQLSRFLNGSELVWDDDVIRGGAHLPLRKLFGEQ